MARKLRILSESAFYHVTSKGNLRGKVFFDDQDRRRFLEILRGTKEKYSYLLHGYALMDTHYHLLMETPRANLSRIMQTINTSYTVYINRRYRRNGHLFRGRLSKAHSACPLHQSTAPKLDGSLIGSVRRLAVSDLYGQRELDGFSSTARA